MDTIEMIPVTSSNVEAIGYAAGDLYVDFRSGARYRYRAVPRATFEQLLETDSVGKALNANVKPLFAYERL